MKQYEKAAIELLHRAYYDPPRDLYSVYANPCQAKREEWERVAECAKGLNGIATVVLHNCQTFSSAVIWREWTTGEYHGAYYTKKHCVVANLCKNTIIASVEREVSL